MAGKGSRVGEFIQNPHRALWKLSVPIMIGMAVQTIYGIVDMMFVGRLGGDAIAALTFNLPLLFFAIGITFGLGAGVTSVISRFLGAKNKKSADNTAEHAVLMGVLMGIILSAGGYLLRFKIFRVLGATEAIIPLAVDYFSVIALGFIFNIMNVFFRSILSGEGDTATPIRFQVAGTVTNIVLDPIFIFVLNLGVRGAAMATVTSQVIVMIFFLHYLFHRKGSYIRFRYSDFRFSPALIGEIFKIGIPASMSMIIMSLGAMLFNWLLVAFGSEAVAAYGLTRYTDQIFFLPIMSMANALVTLVGMFYGAREYRLIRKIWTYAVKKGMMIAVIIGTLFYLISPYMFRIFTADPKILSIAIQYTRLMVFIYPCIVVAMTSGRVFQGFGEGMPGLILTSLRVIVVSMFLAYLSVRVFGKPIQYIWYSLMASSITACTVAFFWIRIRFRKMEDELISN